MLSDSTLRQRVRAILLADWDPIGIRDIPHAHDEYDAYVDKVARMLASGNAAAKLADYLLQVERQSMGLKGTRHRALRQSP